MNLSRTLCLIALLVLASPESGLAQDQTMQRAENSQCVVLLHGLARTSRSMEKMADGLARHGYHTSNVDYPSRSAPIQALAVQAVETGVELCRSRGAKRINFVTHSLGGILVRYYLKTHDLAELGRVVMLAPPNQGSQVVDRIGDWPGFDWLNGPAGQQLGTGENSLPLSLGPANFDVGVIAGNRSINLVLSQMLPNPDDGKVSVENTRLEGMSDFLVVDEAHPFIMRSDQVIEQTAHYLRQGRFGPAGQP